MCLSVSVGMCAWVCDVSVSVSVHAYVYLRACVCVRVCGLPAGALHCSRAYRPACRGFLPAGRAAAPAA